MQSSHRRAISCATTDPPYEKPLMRWAGSKRKLLPTLIGHVPQRHRRYYEPFAGSACLFFALRPDRAVLGDLNKDLIATYKTVRWSPTRVHEALRQFPATERFYYELRDNEPRPAGSVGLAARFIYLNRYCFNGVYRENRRGQFNVPRGRRTPGLPSLGELQTFGQRLRHADLRADDFQSCVDDIRPRDFLYMDPPYAMYAKRQRGEYGYGGFGVEDLERLRTTAETAATKGASVLISYADSNRVRRAFHSWRITAVRVQRSVAGFDRERGVVSELLIKNYD